MHTLSIDIETFSSVDLRKCGAYKYAASPDFQVLIFAYSIDFGPVKVVDCTSGRPPAAVLQALNDPAVKKTAWNAQFERVCLSRLFGAYPGDYLDPAQWECTMVKAAMLGLPMGLGDCARILKVPMQKMLTGMQHIKYFCVPNKKGQQNLPESNPAAWMDFLAYCQRDVEAEQDIAKRIHWFKPPQSEVDLYALDQRINDRGILMDMDFVHSAINLIDSHKETSKDRAFEITALQNPNSVAQLKQWLIDNTGEDIADLKEKTRKLLEGKAGHPEIREMLKLRAELNKASLKKYPVMVHVAGSDNRFRGAHQIQGAGRTGRWAGRLVQIHNLPRNHMAADDYDFARMLVKAGDLAGLKTVPQLTDRTSGVSDAVSQLIRTCFVAPPQKMLCCADFKSIEACVTAWLAGEQWRIDAVLQGKDIYIESAARMFGMDPASIDKKSPLRQRGKVAELALGYQGGVGALKTMGALDMGIPEEDLQGIVDAWRAASPKVKQLWWDVQAAAIGCLTDNEPKFVKVGAAPDIRIKFTRRNGCLVITLPSGRDLYYVRPRLREGKYGKPELLYEGVKGGWMLQKTYGGKLVENIVQAIARDLLGHAMLGLDKYYLKIVAHVHDEAIMEIDDEDVRTVELVEHIMGTPPAWARGLPLSADCFVTEYYMKEA